jgi:hypothetical protein
METSWGLERLSSVRSSSNSLATLMMSATDGDSPVDRTCEKLVYDCDDTISRVHALRKNSLNASLPIIWALARKPDSRRVSWRNFAISNRTRNSFLCFSS